MSLQRIWNSKKRKARGGNGGNSKKMKQNEPPMAPACFIKPSESPHEMVIDLSSDICQYCARSDPKEGEMMRNDPQLAQLEVIGHLGKNESTLVHYCCVFFARGLRQLDPPTMDGTFGFRPGDISKNLEKYSKTKCCFCKNVYAASNCSKCGVAFHFPCGAENGVMFNYEKFTAYCPKHRPQQEPRSCQTSIDSRCLICQDDILCEPGFEQHRSACCHHWFHRSCLQQLAFSAASAHLKCPLCNDVDKFRQELLNFGFHIPLRDAAWEHDPENFRQMYEIGFSCYAKTCVCPMGRTFDGGLESVYDHLVCSVCGNNAVHRSCTVTASLGEKWICIDCDDTRLADSGDDSDDDIAKFF